MASSPEFEGLSAFGDTEDEALAEMKIVLAMEIRAYEAEGLVLPEPQRLPDHSGQFRLRLPKSLHAQLAARAEAEGVSLNQLAVSYLSAQLASKLVCDRVETALQEYTRAIREQQKAPTPSRVQTTDRASIA